MLHFRDSVMRFLIVLSPIGVAICACASEPLRGSATQSADGRTYLVVADDNGGACGPILLDGTQWAFAIDSAGPVTPGVHRIACGSEVEFSVDSGTTFRFNYWGP